MDGLSTVPANQERIDHIRRAARREASAFAVLDALMACEKQDRLQFLEALMDGIRKGMPYSLHDGQVMAEANWWAEEASRAERKAYCAACYTRLSPADQSAFRSFIEERTAA